MHELKIAVTRALGTCTADPPMLRGDYFTVRDGDIRIPEGGYVCMWALQSILPLIPVKEREIAESKDDDWMWRVHHAQCPDPDGRVIFKIEQVGTVEKGVDTPRVRGTSEQSGSRPGYAGGTEGDERKLRDLRVIVEEVGGTCTSGMAPGDHFILRSGRLYIPARRHFCLYALQAVLPLLPAKQRPLEDSDWLKEDNLVICPDPAGNVVMRIEAYP